MENKEQLKDAMTEAIVQLQGARFILAAIADEENGSAIVHQECSFNQAALIIKSILKQNEMLRMDVMTWCIDQVEKDMDKKKIITKN